MISVKDAEGVPYDAAKHWEVYGLKKITEEQSKRTNVFYSYFQPNGGAEMSSSDKERVYYIVKGSITVKGKAGKLLKLADKLKAIKGIQHGELVMSGAK